jgi:hypothetical protein
MNPQYIKPERNWHIMLRIATRQRNLRHVADVQATSK